MRRFFSFAFLLLTFTLLGAACQPASSATPTPASSATLVPSPTFHPRRGATPTPSLTPIPGGAAQGDILDFFVYNSMGGEDKYIFTRFSQASYTFQAGDFVEYDVKLLNNVPGAGGIEIYNTDETSFRPSEGWADQNGLAGNPNADLSAQAFNAWYHRKLAVPEAMVGKTSAQWTLAGENDADFLVYRANYDNLVITDGNGVIKKIIFKESSDFQWDDLYVVEHTSGSASLSPVNINGGPPGNPRVITPLYPDQDIVIASFIVTESPYNADNTGVEDATAAIQKALTDCYNAGGGVVWIPVGTYRVTASLHIPPHVTLRGDWRDPDKGAGRYGAVILADVPPGPDSAPGLFRIWGSAGVKGLTVYYPHQSAREPVEYPYTFEILGRYLGEDGYMSGSVQNVTLLNAYRGISAGKDNTHELHAIRNVKGTVLALGIYLQDTADVGKVERITFNPSYWAQLDPSVSPTHPGRDEINAWTRANGLGLQLGGVEWDELTDISVSDYQLGLGFVAGRRINSTVMIFGLTIKNSNIAMRISDLDGRVGVVVSNATLQANQGENPIALQVTRSNGASVIFNNSTIGGGAFQAVELLGNVTAGFHNVTFDDWTGPYAITAKAGSLVVEGSTFTPALSSKKKGIGLLSQVYSAAILGNSYPAGGADFLLDNTSVGDVKRQDTGYTFEQHQVDAYPWRPSLPHPSSDHLYNVRLAPYNAQADGTTDDTRAIQRALDEAGAAGGGTVYLPPGIYFIETHLNVPANVELRGSDDAPHRALLMGRGAGTVLYAVEGWATSDPDAAPPFILLNGANAGVRGLSIHYPDQSITSAEDIVAYPWTIRGKGKGVYVYDVAFSNAWRGVDFATYPTDQHSINQVVGFVLKEGLRVGNSSEGWLEDNLFNINAWARAYGLPNILGENVNMFNVAAKYSRANLRAFVVTEGAENEHVLSNFVYGAQTGYTFEKTANAVAINIAADGGQNTLNFTGTGANGVKVINIEGCGCVSGTALQVSDGTAKVWNMLTMETYEWAINVTGGDTLLQGASFHHSRAAVNGGNLTLNGLQFRASGPHVNNNTATFNSRRHLGGGGFSYNGTPASASDNVKW
jgi:hypothetical protein